MDARELLELYAVGKRNFSEIDLMEADLKEANLQGADFKEAILRSSDFEGANLQKTILSYAQMQYTNLQRANLQGANLRGANLRAADFQGADLRGADLTAANIEKTNFRGAIFDDRPKLPIQRSLKQAFFDNEFFPRIEAVPPRTNPIYYPSPITRSNNLAYEIERLSRETKCYTPKNTKEAEKQIIKSIAQRQGQPEFRRRLLRAYESRCVITGCNAEEALEAAHINPYRENQNNDSSNGLLLRSDIHTLFDLNLIAIDTNTRVHIHSRLHETFPYRDYHFRLLTPPNDEDSSPNR